MKGASDALSKRRSGSSDKGQPMLWAAIVTGALGLILGLRFRVPAMLAASAGVALACAIAAPWTELSVWVVALVAYGLVTTLQGGYLVGAMVANARPHVQLILPPAAPHAFAEDEPPTGRGARGH
jgi:hypothetical protein